LEFESLQEALDMFRENEEKRRILEKIPSGDKISAYRVGQFVDLCRGPHVAHSGKVGQLRLLKSSSVVHPDGKLQQRVGFLKILLSQCEKTKTQIILIYIRFCFLYARKKN